MWNSAFIARHLCLLAVTNQSFKQQRPLWSGVEGKLLRDDASFLLLVLLLPL